MLPTPLVEHTAAPAAQTARAARRPIDGATPNAEAWLGARVLRVGQDLFEISVNPPTAEAVSLQAFPLVGYPLLPNFTLAFADEDECRWRWLRRRAAGGSNGGGAGGNGAGGSNGGGAAAGEWEDTGCRDACYTPAPKDEGCVLRAELTPARRGGAAGEPLAADAGPVAAGPPLPAAAARQVAPPAPAAAPAFRVMSYNILADQYAGTAYAQKVRAVRSDLI